MRWLLLPLTLVSLLGFAACGNGSDAGSSSSASDSDGSSAIQTYTDQLEALCGSELLTADIQTVGRNFSPELTVREPVTWFTQDDYEEGVEAPPMCQLNFVDDPNSEVQISIDPHMSSFYGTRSVNPISSDPDYTCEYSMDFTLGSEILCPLEDDAAVRIQYDLAISGVVNPDGSSGHLMPQDDESLLTRAAIVVLYDLEFLS